MEMKKDLFEIELDTNLNCDEKIYDFVYDLENYLKSKECLKYMSSAYGDLSGKLNDIKRIRVHIEAVTELF